MSRSWSLTARVAPGWPNVVSTLFTLSKDEESYRARRTVSARRRPTPSFKVRRWASRLYLDPSTSVFIIKVLCATILYLAEQEYDMYLVACQ